MLERLAAISLCAAATYAAVRIVPTPQYLEPLASSITLARGGTCTIVLGPPQSARNSKMLLAADFIGRRLRETGSSVKVEAETPGKPITGAQIHLWEYAADTRAPVTLNTLDRETLAHRPAGQSYVIRTPDDHTISVVGAGDQAVLWGAMTLMQLIRSGPGGTTISGVYIRDYPHFEFRAASDWLLNVEGNRWALDRGQGIESYARLCERKLDRALQYKINMVLFDGFGWGLEQRFPAYPALMRRLNGYARARGIHLVFGGYGASYGMAYQHGPLYEEGAYLGKVFENRERYPDGTIYRCMGFPTSRSGVDPATLGSCRSNEELNRLKAEELRRFVDAVEPGALYIHHEDFGGYSGTQRVWLQRCRRCRERWPNDSLEAPDGGAGALANGYSALLRAVNSVKHPGTGYDASRDCQVILVSPVYVPGSPDSEEWSRVIDLWRTIGERLPQGGNTQVCFREVFPQKYGGATWTDSFNSAIQRAGLNLGIFLFFAGGADNFITDYPFTGVPALNAMFQGARTIYNFCGDFYQEPMEIVNAEYSWNQHSTGFYRDPRTNAEAVEMWRRFMLPESEARELLEPGGLYATACDLLYGPKAGPIMAAYYRTSTEIPDIGEALAGPDARAAQYTYLPMTWNRAYSIPTHWRHLALDAKTWGREISNEAYRRSLETLKLSRAELHRRLARRWGIVSSLNLKGASFVDLALASEPLPQAIDDLRFLQTSFRVYQPLLEALETFHGALCRHFGDGSDEQWRSGLAPALAKARQAQQLADRSFPEPLDPVGGEVGSLRTHARRLVQAIELWMEKSPK